MSTKLIDQLGGFRVGDLVHVNPIGDSVFKDNIIYEIVDFEDSSLSLHWACVLGEDLYTGTPDRRGLTHNRRWIQIDFVTHALSENDIEYYSNGEKNG